MSNNAIILPTVPQAEVTIREATIDDVAFIDELQKRHRAGVGFMHRGTLEGKIAAREVLVAIDSRAERVGYVIGTDRYFSVRSTNHTFNPMT
jgi:hypothetical protein